MTSIPVFSEYSRIYDVLYGDKDYAAEVGYVDTLLSRHGIAGRDLLEFGSGTGKHGRLLAGLGYRVTGIERSAQMVERAGKAPGFDCQQGDVCTVHLGRKFDAVLSLFHVVSYQVSNESVCDLFMRAAEHLNVGGLFLFDVWYSPAVYAQDPEVRVKRVSDGATEITRIAEPVPYVNENRIDVHYTVFAYDTKSGGCQTFEEIHAMRHFSLPELKLLAGMNGFEWLTAEAFLTGAEPGEETWGVCVVLRRA